MFFILAQHDPHTISGISAGGEGHLKACSVNPLLNVLPWPKKIETTARMHVAQARDLSSMHAPIWPMFGLRACLNFFGQGRRLLLPVMPEHQIQILYPGFVCVCVCVCV